MKKILAVLFVLLISQIVFAQAEAYKIAEFWENGGGCDNYSRYVAFTEEIAKNEGNKGLVVIYAGNSKERFGNVLAYANTAIKGIEDRLRFPKGKVSIVILEGKKFFAQEFWVIPKGAKSPYSESYQFDWSKLQNKYLFAKDCFQCEPSYPTWTDFQVDYKHFAEILRKYSNYKGEIILNNYDDLITVRQILTKNENLPRNRYSIQFRKKKKGEEWSGNVDLYLVPNSKTKTKISFSYQQK